MDLDRSNFDGLAGELRAVEDRLERFGASLNAKAVSRPTAGAAAGMDLGAIHAIKRRMGAILCGLAGRERGVRP